MSFLGSIIGAIGSALGFVGSATSDIAGAVGPILDTVSSDVASIASTVESSLATAVTASVGAVGTVASGVFGVIETGFADASTVLTGILGSMQKYVDAVTSEVNHINDSFIKPVTDTALILDKSITSLITELHTDIHGGIQGILSIPDALAGALTTVDAQLGRAMQELGLANKEAITSTLLPGLQGIAGVPLGNLATIAAAQAGTPVSLVDQIGQLHIASCIDTSAYMTKMGETIAQIKQGTGWVGDFGRLLMTVFWVLPYLAESVRNDIECFGQLVNQQNPIKTLDLGATVKAMYRGVLSAGDAATEAARQGLSGTRFQALVENELWLPGPVEALQLFYRGMIDQTDLEAVLTKQALTKEDVQAVQGAFLEPQNPVTAMDMYARMQAGKANFLPASLGSVVPGMVADMYPARYRASVQAEWDWLRHWKIPGLEWWFTAWTRGMRTEEEFRLAAQAENIPFDVIDDMIPIFQEPIQLWMIPDMLAAGIFSDEEALSYLHYIGMDDASSGFILKYGESKAKAPAAAQAAELAGITASIAKTMFEDGIIPADTYTEVLTEHGFSADAAALMVQLADLQLKTKAVAASTAAIVQQAIAGQITPADAVSQLYAAGRSTVQVDRAVAKIAEASVGATKHPSRADWDEWRKLGVVDSPTWQAAYAALGYSAADVALYEKAWEAKYGT